MLRQVLAESGTALLGRSSCPGLFEHPLVLILPTTHRSRALLLKGYGAALGHTIGILLVVNGSARHALLLRPVLLLLLLLLHLLVRLMRRLLVVLLLVMLWGRLGMLLVRALARRVVRPVLLLLHRRRWAVWDLG